VSTYDALAALPVEVGGYELAGLRQDVSSGFTRRTTIVSIHGAGETGVGEDVTYDADEQGTFQVAGSVHDLAGSHTLDSFSELIGSLDLFPAGAPEIDGWRLYRRWAFESAALDLALRQSKTTLAEALGREARPVTFVVSTRLGDPPSTERVRDIVAGYPGTRFKLDPTKDWNEALVEELAALDVVATVDLKGAYHGTIVDNPADPALYLLVAEGFPGAWIEDPDLTSPPPRRRPRALPRPDHLGRDHPLRGRRRGAALPAERPEHQAVALRQPAGPPRHVRLLRRARDRRLRRRAVRARAGPRTDPVPRLALQCGRSERRRARRLQRTGRRPGAAGEPAPA
jgi:hypothetical protein